MAKRLTAVEGKLMRIKDLVDGAYGTAKEKGWHDAERSFGDMIALCHSELSEALEAFRVMGLEYPWYSWKDQNHGTVYGQFPPDGVNPKPEAVAHELADVVIRIADMCGSLGIDLEKALQEKMAHNKTRPYRHGGKKL